MDISDWLQKLIKLNKISLKEYATKQKQKLHTYMYVHAVLKQIPKLKTDLGTY